MQDEKNPRKSTKILMSSILPTREATLMKAWSLPSKTSSTCARASFENCLPISLCHAIPAMIIMTACSNCFNSCYFSVYLTVFKDMLQNGSYKGCWFDSRTLYTAHCVSLSKRLNTNIAPGATSLMPKPPEKHNLNTAHLLFTEII